MLADALRRTRHAQAEPEEQGTDVADMLAAVRPLAPHVFPSRGLVPSPTEGPTGGVRISKDTQRRNQSRCAASPGMCAMRWRVRVAPSH